MRIEELPDLFARITADLAPHRITPAMGVYDLERQKFVVGTVALDAADATALAEMGEEGLVLLVPSRQVPLADITEGDDIDASEIVSVVQDWAMDELGREWPEVTDADGDFVALLVPVEDEDGLVWAAHGQASVPVGQLTRHRA